MKHLKKSFTLLVLLTSIMGSRTFAQDYFNLKGKPKGEEVMQDNEYVNTGFEQGNFFSNPLRLNGRPLDYSVFNLKTKGDLTLVKGSVVTGDTIQVPFYVYLRRNGNKVPIPGMERPDAKQLKIDISAVLGYAEPGDLVVIEAVRKEDGPVKRILKILGGC